MTKYQITKDLEHDRKYWMKLMYCSTRQDKTRQESLTQKSAHVCIGDDIQQRSEKSEKPKNNYQTYELVSCWWFYPWLA